MSRGKRPTRTIVDELAALHADRKARGVCRHCGGKVPCWSPFGDQRVGVKHSSRTKAKRS